jgi:flagellar protein FliL
MADKDKEQTPADPAAKPAKKSSKGKLFIIVGVVVVLLGGGGLAAYYTMRKPADATAAAEAPKKEAHAGTGIISFEPFVVNLADAGGQRFLRISVRLIVGDEEEAKHIQESEVQVMRLRSGILELLTAQTSDRIVTPDGKGALKKEIAELAAHVVEPIEVSDVLFSDFVVQY